MEMLSSEPQLEIDVAPAYEILMEMAVAGRPELYDAHRDESPWLETVFPRVSPELRAAVERFTAGCEKIFPHLVAPAYDSPAPRNAVSFIAYLEGLEPMQIYLYLLGYHLRHFRRATPPEVMRAAAGGDADARRRFLKTSYPDDTRWQAALRRLLSLSPEEAKTETLEILHRWQAEVFSTHEAEVMPILARDAEAKRALMQGGPPRGNPESVIAAAASGFEYAPEPGIRRVLLIPSYAARPWVHALDRGDLKIFCYGVADESIAESGDTPPPRLVRLTRALGDERRLQVLKLLDGGRYALPEIAEHFGVAKTTMHHHLLILRSAGLIRVRSSDRTYVLQEDALPRVSEMLIEYLSGRPPSDKGDET
jgi:DNA-binding transcriptional ArsR family regulator